MLNSIIGTGINIVSRPSDTPYPATSLDDEGIGPTTPRALLAAYLAALDHWLGNINSRCSLKRV